MRDGGDGGDAPMRVDAGDEGGASRDAGGFRGALSGDGGRALRSGGAWLERGVPPAGGARAAAGALSGGGQRASGAGPADGGAVGPAGGDGRDLGPRFDAPVGPGGYVWWYVDAFSDDGRFGLTIIAFVGSVFSPYYAWSDRRTPENHCAVNVALYGEARGWAMTERGGGALRRSRDSFALGASGLAWDGAGLNIWIEERCAPRLKGRVRLEAEGLNPRAFALASHGGHLWRPIAPRARVEVRLERPELCWRGFGYFDSNQGEEPLEAGFRRWNWSRARLSKGARVFYEAERRREGALALSLGFAEDGTAFDCEPPPRARLPKSRWRIARETRGEGARVLSTLEDAPFYARSRIAHRLAGEDAISMHEALDLDRFASPIVKAMLPFRMPRRG